MNPNPQSAPSPSPALAPEPSVRAAVSAWMDEAQREAPQWLHGAHADAARAAWDDFHAVGDLLRAPALAQPIGAAPRAQRLRQSVLAQLAATPQDGLEAAGGSMAPAAPLPPVHTKPSVSVAQEVVVQPRALGDREAANSPLWRWRVAAAVATVVAVGSLVWNLGPGGAGAGAQLAQDTSARQPSALLAQGQPGSDATVPTAEGAAGTVAVATGAGVMIRDPRLDELLAAHRQHGGASALQLPTGFLRAATFDGTGR